MSEKPAIIKPEATTTIAFECTPSEFGKIKYLVSELSRGSIIDLGHQIIVIEKGRAYLIQRKDPVVEAPQHEAWRAMDVIFSKCFPPSHEGEGVAIKVSSDIPLISPARVAVNIELTGKTYEIREKLSELGYRWNEATRAWHKMMIYPGQGRAAWIVHRIISKLSALDRKGQPKLSWEMLAAIFPGLVIEISRLVEAIQIPKLMLRIPGHGKT